MNLSRTIVLLAVVGSLQVSLAYADIPPLPRDLPPGKSMEGLKVKVDATKDISILRIPRSALDDAGIEIREKKNAKPSAWSPSKTRSLVAASAMSLGIGGVFLLRKKRGAAIAAALAGATVLGTLGAHAWGNAAPMPPEASRPTLPASFSGNVVIEIVDGEGDVHLTIGTKPMPKYQRALPPGSEAPPKPDAR